MGRKLPFAGCRARSCSSSRPRCGPQISSSWLARVLLEGVFPCRSTSWAGPKRWSEHETLIRVPK